MVLFQYPPQSIQVSSGPLAIEVDGVITNVSIDTVTPANTVAVPVSIYSASGPINITAGDINVQLTDLGVNFDRTRIGDGTNQWNMNASNEGLVHDASANAELDSQTALLTTIDADTSALAGTVATDGASHPSTGIIVGGQNGSGLFRHLSVTNAGVLNVTGPLTDTQLRASAVPVSMASTPLPTGAATETTLAAVNAKLPATLGGLKANADSLAVCMSLEQQTIIQDTLNSLDTLRTNVGPVNETAPATDTANSGLNGRLQRIAQRITSSISSLTDIFNRLTDILNGTGSPSDSTVTNPATNATILSYARGILSRLSTQLPAALGQTTMSASLPVTISSDQSAIPVSAGVQAAVTVKQAAITVGTSAVRLTTDGSAPSSTRQKLVFQPLSTSTGNFYWGSSSVASSGGSRGVQIFPGANEVFINDANDYYIISDTAAQTVLITEAE